MFTRLTISLLGHSVEEQVFHRGLRLDQHPWGFQRALVYNLATNGVKSLAEKRGTFIMSAS